MMKQVKAKAKDIADSLVDSFDTTWDGLDFPKERFEALQRLDRTAWRREVIGREELFLDLHDHLPMELIYEANSSFAACSNS